MRGGHYAGYASNQVLFSLENLNFTIFCPNTTPSTSCFGLLLFSIRSWNLENFSLVVAHGLSAAVHRLSRVAVSQGYSRVVMCRLLLAVASLVASVSSRLRRLR